MYVYTYWFASMSADFFCLTVNELILLHLGQGFSFTIVSFGIAMNMQNICRAQCPLKRFVCWPGTAGQLKLLIAGCLIRHHLVFESLWRTSICRRYTAFCFFFWNAQAAWSFPCSGFGMRYSLQLGIFLLLRLWLYFNCIWKNNTAMVNCKLLLFLNESKNDTFDTDRSGNDFQDCASIYCKLVRKAKYSHRPMFKLVLNIVTNTKILLFIAL